MSALQIKLNVLLLFLMLTIVQCAEQDEAALANRRKAEITSYCQYLVKGHPYYNECLSACIARRLPLKEPDENHYSHRVAKQYNCVAY